MFFPERTYITDTVWGKFCLPVGGDGVAARIAKSEIWDPFLKEKVYDRYLNPNSVIIDVGANYGSQTIPLARRCKKVYAFEPQVYIFKCLERTVELNKITNVELFNFALGNHDCRVQMLDGPQENYAYGSFQASSCWLREDAGGEIVCKTLDSFDFEGVDLIKSDAQGYDYSVIQGGIKTIKKFSPLIAFELDNHPVIGTVKLADFECLLGPLGYSFELLDDEGRDYLAIKK